MKFPLLVSVFLLMARASPVDITVRGTEGGEAIIKCPYPAGYEQSQKYFYKGPYKDNNLIFKSNGRQSSVFSGRFSLKDDHQTSFTVTIKNLQMTDTGFYCYAAGWGYSKSVQLNVFKAPEKPKPVQISTSTIHPNTNTSTETLQAESVTPITSTENTTVQDNQQMTLSNTGLASVAGGLGLVLLVLVLCSGTFLILKKKERKCETALTLENVQQNTTTDLMYEEILPNDVISTASLSNQTPSSEITVYATVTNQKNDLVPGHTQSTNQVKNRDCDYYGGMKSSESTLNNRAETIYVTATLPQSLSNNDSPIYSEINL